MKQTVLCTTLAALLLTPVAHAALIATEQFSYTAGAIAGKNGGSGFTSVWRGGGTVDAVGQTYPGLATDGGGYVSDGNNGANFRDLGSTYGADGTTIFVSLLISAQPGFSTTNPDYAGFSFFDGGDARANERFYLGQTFRQGVYGFVRDGDSDNLSSASVSTASSLLVLEINFLAGPDNVSLYINPTTGLAAPDGTPTIASVTSFNFDRIRIQSGFNAAPFKFDEIRIGTTYADVSPVPVPEPTSMILLGISGAALLARRRGRDLSA